MKRSTGKILWAIGLMLFVICTIAVLFGYSSGVFNKTFMWTLWLLFNIPSFVLIIIALVGHYEEDELEDEKPLKLNKLKTKMAKEKEKKSYGWIIFLVILAVLVILFLVLNTWQVPYVIKENYDTQVPYQTTESYYETVNANNCDSVSGCSCLHVSWLGLGSCDSCNCLKYRTVTAYRTEIQQKDVTQYCSALNKLVGNC